MNMNYLYKIFPHDDYIDHIVRFHDECGDAQETYREVIRFADKFSSQELLRVKSDLKKHLTRHYLDMYLEDVEVHKPKTIEAHLLQDLEWAIQFDLGSMARLPTLTEREFWAWGFWKKLQFRKRRARHFLRTFDERFSRHWQEDTWEKDYRHWNTTVGIMERYIATLFPGRRPLIVFTRKNLGM